MTFTTTEEHVCRAEQELGLILPPAYRARLLRENGGEVEAADDTWQLFPVRDTTDRKRISRTANHLLREMTEARAWPRFPSLAVAIAANGSGDYLIIHPAESQPDRLADMVLHWDHETGALTPVEVTWDV
jgi:hypothetical protein